MDGVRLSGGPLPNPHSPNPLLWRRPLAASVATHEVAGWTIWVPGRGLALRRRAPSTADQPSSVTAVLDGGTGSSRGLRFLIQYSGPGTGVGSAGAGVWRGVLCTRAVRVRTGRVGRGCFGPGALAHRGGRRPRRDAQCPWLEPRWVPALGPSGSARDAGGVGSASGPRASGLALGDARRAGRQHRQEAYACGYSSVTRPRSADRARPRRPLPAVRRRRARRVRLNRVPKIPSTILLFPRVPGAFTSRFARPQHVGRARVRRPRTPRPTRPARGRYRVRTKRYDDTRQCDSVQHARGDAPLRARTRTRRRQLR